MPKGGKREGAGPKPRSDSPAKRRSIRFTDAEWELIKQKAKDGNYKDASDYIRSVSLNAEIKVNVKEEK